MNLSEPVKTGAMLIPCSLKLLSDELLVVRAKAGDTSAFVELRERHSTKVLRTLYPECRHARGEREELLKRAMLRPRPGLRDVIELR